MLLGCSAVVVGEGACVRDCRGIGLCKVGTVHKSVSVRVEEVGEVG
jgi:hypothetical protein